MKFFFALLVIFALISNVIGFSTLFTSRRPMTSSSQIRMSSTPPPQGNNDDKLEPIRTKMQADKNYNPMTDPEAMKILDSVIPDKLRSFPAAIQRMKVAIQDSRTGVTAVPNGDINAAARNYGDKSKAIQSPQSKFIKAGAVPSAEEKPSKEKKQAALEKLKSTFPGVGSK
jgi:hypothetical protein